MKSRPLELRDEAWQEWQEASLWYDLEKPGLGDRFDKAVLATLEHLCTVAAHYQLRENGFRHAPVKRFPFLIVFEIDEGTIVVYNVFHTSRKLIKKRK